MCYQCADLIFLSFVLFFSPHCGHGLKCRQFFLVVDQETESKKEREGERKRVRESYYYYFFDIIILFFFFLLL